MYTNINNETKLFKNNETKLLKKKYTKLLNNKLSVYGNRQSKQFPILIDLPIYFDLWICTVCDDYIWARFINVAVLYC